MLKIGVVSLGCSKNRVDSEIMMGYLTQGDYALTNNPQEADIVVVNTCGFIEPAKQESIDTVLEMARYKETGRCSTLVMTGCLSQRYREQLIEELPEVDIFLGINEYAQLPALIDSRYPEKEKSNSACRMQEMRVLSTPSHYAYLRVADGCDNRCAFCAIPLIRGGYVSRDMESLVAEAQDLAKRGVKELLVIAQDTTRYGLDRYGKHMLPELLRELAKTDITWIRLLYTYPNEIDDALLEAMMGSEKILKYIDMPIQHVDDELLKRMNRRGSRAQLCGLMKKIRALDPRFVLRTSLIVGFPGETEAQFASLCNFIEEHPFDRMGVFTYSPEDATPAYDYGERIDPDTALSRYRRLMALQQQHSRQLLQKRVGSLCDVLIEGYDKRRQCYYGRSYAEAPDIDGCVWVKMPGEGKEDAREKTGAFQKVRMIKALEYDLMGEASDEFGQ